VSATFTDHAFFFSTAFGNDAYFSKATFSKAGFTSATFARDAVFMWATFSDASFNKATFSGKSNFYFATFSYWADFSLATFSGDAIFASKFGGENPTRPKCANFTSATFLKSADFDTATFSKPVDFVSATFAGPTDFTLTQFCGGANFASARFSGTIKFLDAQFASMTTFAKADFAAHVPDFRGAKMHEATEWHDCGWPEPPHDIEAAQAQVDAYERLKQEMERLKKHEDEQRFFCKELRARRRLAGWIGWMLNFLYGASSNYGQSVMFPLLWLLGLWVLGGSVFYAMHTTTPSTTIPHAAALSFGNLIPFVPITTKS
jgi:uncharacterized protein YjbI with pentapeptide repeats